MTSREKHIDHKKKEIEKIEKRQARLIKKVTSIPPLTQSKRMDVNIRRLGKFVAIAMQIRALEMQKQMIIAQPIPKVNGFLAGGPAIVGESGPEVILKVK